MPYSGWRVEESPLNPSQRHCSRNLPYASEVISKSSRADIASQQSSHGISQKLISLVTKFESLDAVSLPFAIPALQPAPLQVSRNEARKRIGTAGGPKKRLPTRFSPKKGSGEQDENERSEETAPSKEIFCGSSTLKTPNSSAKSHNKKSLCEPQDWYKTISVRGSIRLHGSFNQPAAEFQREGTNSITAPYVENESPTKQNVDSIQDKIKFYDGSISTGNTRAKPSICTATQPLTPISEKRLHNNASRSRKLTQNSRSKQTRIQVPDLQTPAKTKNLSKQQNLIFGLTPPKPFLEPDSPSQSTIRDVSPLTTTTCGQAVASTGKNANLNSTLQLSSIVKQNTRLGEEERGRKRWVKHGRMNQTPINETRISDKIGELYRANSLETKHEAPEECSQQPSTFLKQRQFGGLKPPHQDGYPDRKKSNVAYVRRMFEKERQKSPVCSILTSPQKFTAPLVKSKELTTRPSFSHPPPSAVSQATPGRAEAILPKTIRQPAIFGQPDIRESQLTFAVKKRPQAKGKLIGDKIKQFENKNLSAEVVVQSSRTSIARKMNKSLKGFFEPQKIMEESKQDKGLVLNESEIKEVIDRLQENKWQLKIGRTSSFMGRWNNIPPSLTDGAMSEKTASNPDGEEVDVLIIKEVECGLKHPKPLRVVEMRRMMLLCREKIGIMTKGKVTRAVNL